MEFLLRNFASLIMLFLENSIPSKNSKRYKKNVKLLQKQDWFRLLVKEYNPILLMNVSIRAKIMEYDDKGDLHSFRTELERLVKAELG